MKTITWNVQGMSCGHCVSAVEKGVGKLEGVQSVQVDLENGTVTVQFNEEVTSNHDIEEAIDDQGYEVVS